MSLYSSWGSDARVARSKEKNKMKEEDRTVEHGRKYSSSYYLVICLYLKDQALNYIFCLHILL